MNKKALILSILLLLPILNIVEAAGALPPAPTFGGIYGGLMAFQTIIIKILDIVWYAFVGIAVTFFVIAGIQFLTAQGDPGKVSLANKSVVFGLLGVVVALIAYSIVSILKAALSIP